MKKLNNEAIEKNRKQTVFSATMCPTNCSACQPSGCACTKCYDSVSDTVAEVKNAYNK